MRAIYHAIEYAELPNTYNASQGEDVSIRPLHEMVAEILDYNKVNWIEKKLDIKERSFLNIEAIRKDLHWTPEVNIREGLEKTIAWHNESMSVSYMRPDSILVS